MTPLVTPTVHSNGTSKEELVRQHLAVMEAATDLLKALEAGTPHGRDYYPQGGNAHSNASKAWTERQVMVQQLYNAIEMQAMKITLEGL